MKFVGGDDGQPKFAISQESYGSRLLAIWDLGLESFAPSVENPAAHSLDSRGSQLGNVNQPWLKAARARVPMATLEHRLALGL